MSGEPALLDSDTLSELTRGNARVVTRAREYLATHGRLAFASVTLFERLRGYRAALAEGKPYDQQLLQFNLFAASCIVVPFDEAAADRAAVLWASTSRRRRGPLLGDLLIAATAAAHGRVLVTRNRRDFEPLARLLDGELRLADWAR